MMHHLRPDDLRQLESDVATFAANPRRFLAEAEQCLRLRRDPVEALALLAGMFGVYTEGPDDQRGLNDAGKWLERRILRDPQIPADRLLRELGWLQRINVVHQHMKAISPRPRPISDNTVRREFGERLQQLRDRPPPRPTGPSLRDQDLRPARVEALLRDLAPNNAATRLPELLADLDPAARRALAERCVAALTRKRVREAQKANKAWVSPLTAILGELP